MKYNKKCIIAVMLLTVIILQTGCAAPKFGKMYKQRNNTETAVDKTGIESDKSKESGTEAAEKEELEETEYRRGNIEGNHFESEWMNLKIDIPEFYVVLTQEEMDKAYNDGKEFMDEGSADFFQYKLEKGGIMYY